MRRFGLRYQLAGWLLLLGVVPAVAVSAYLYSVTRVGLFREAAALMRADADATVDRLGESFEVVRQQLSLAARQAAQRVLDAKVNQRPRVRPKSSPRFDFTPAAAVLASWGKGAPVPMETWAVVDASAEPRLAFVEGEPGAGGATSDADRELAVAAQTAPVGEVVFGGIGESAQTARRVVRVATAIAGVDGMAIGSLHGEIPVEWFRRVVEVRVTSGGSLWVFDHEGRVVLSTDSGSEQEDAGALFAASRGSDGRLVQADVRGVPSATVLLPLTVAGSSAPWAVVVSTPEQAIARKAEPWRHAAAVAGLAVVVILGAAVISAGITRPIATLEEGTRRIAQGDLEFQVPVSGQNELARLAASFHQMAYALKRAEERLTKSERLAAIGEESLAIHREVNAPLASLIETAAALKAQPDLPADVREQIAPLYEKAVRMRELLLNLEHAHHARDAEPVRDFAPVPGPDRQAGGAA
jgi:HAMP domain-containing protein